jgi:hypothetical protein
MKRWGIAAAVVCGLVLAGGCKRELKDFTSAEGKFKVKMPGTPKESSQAVAGTNLKMYSVEERNGGYMVAFSDVPMGANEPEAQIQSRLDGARDGMIRNVNGKLQSESKVTLQGKYPGRDVRADIPDKKGVLRCKFYLVDRRLYQVMVVGTPSFCDSSEANQFLDSLAVTQ